MFGPAKATFDVVRFPPDSAQEFAIRANDLNLSHSVVSDVQISLGIEGDPVGLVVDLARSFYGQIDEHAVFTQLSGTTTGKARMRLRLLSPTNNSLPPGRITIPLGKASPLAIVWHFRWASRK